MHPGRAASAPGDRKITGEERGLANVAFVGSYPAADFPTHPKLPEIALLGRSNVGKSSLLNRLIDRRSLAHTSKTPGKTRTCNLFQVGQRLYLVDLPGYGYAKAAKTARHGFARLLREYLSGRSELVGVVWLLDIRRDPSRDDHEARALLAARGVPVILAVTKADKLSRGRRGGRVQAIRADLDAAEVECVVTSARTREGIAELREAVLALIPHG